MKIILPILLALTSSLSAQVHLFTDKKGRNVAADITRADKKSVWLKLSNGKISKISRDKLIKENQKHIDAWIANQLPSIRVEPKFVRGRTKNQNNYSGSKHTQSLSFSVSFSNYSPELELAECEVIYYFIGRLVPDKTQYKVLSRQVRKMSMPPNGSASVKFTDIVNHFGDNSGHQGIDYVLFVKRKSDGRTVYLESPNKLIGKNKESITYLVEGDVTNETFVKPKEKKNEEDDPGETDVITIR